MARQDARTPRLFVEAALKAEAVLTLERAQANYLCNVMRLKRGDPVLVFNGRDGEWRATVEAARREALLTVIERTQVQPSPGLIHYAFAPLKHARLDYMVQKAVEMGAARLEPVFTRRSVAERVNLKRMRANAIEAAEQCGALTVPEIAEPVPFSSFVAEFDESRLLVFCDEEADMQDPIAALAAARPLGGEPVAITVLVGPEGGFADSERSALLRLPKVVRLSLGPRILRADTAAVAALAFVGAVLGDWR